MINPCEGCRFRERCPYAIDKCAQVTPLPGSIGSTQVACHVAVAEARNASDHAGTASIG